jgi:hypothetical protein
MVETTERGIAAIRRTGLEHQVLDLSTSRLYRN